MIVTHEPTLQQVLDGAKDMEEIIRAHKTFVKSLITGSFLVKPKEGRSGHISKKAAAASAILTVIRKLIIIILHFKDAYVCCYC